MAQEKITFQPKPGFKELLEEIAKKDDRSVAYVINRYVEQGLIKDGFLQDPEK